MNSTKFSIIEIVAGTVALVQGEHSADAVHVSRIIEIEAASGIPAALRELDERYQVRDTRLIVLLPRHKVFMRRIMLPAATAQEIGGMVQFEAEKHLPFPADRAVVGYFPCGPSGVSGTAVMMVAVKQEMADEQLRALNEAGLMPDALSVSAAAIAALSPEVYSGAPGPRVVLGFEKNALEVDIFDGSGLAFSRGVNMNNAGAAGVAAEQFRREIQYSLSAFDTAREERPYTFYYRLGRDVSPGTVDELAQGSGTPWHPLPVRLKPSLSFAAGIPEELTNRYGGSALLALPSTPQPDLLPPAVLRHRQARRERKLMLTGGIVAVSAIIVIGLITVLAGYCRSGSRRAMEEKLRAVEPYLPALRAIDRDLSRIDQFTEGNTRALEIMKELSAILPARVYVQQLDYDAIQRTVVVRGRTDAYAQASKLVSLLAASRLFSQVTGKGAHTVKVGDQDLVDFEVSCTLRNDEHTTPE